MPVIFNDTIGTSDIGVTVQGYDSDLTAIAALTTTAYGRGLLAIADSSGITVQTGTWTPAYVMGTSGSVTASTATGYWGRVNNFVYATAMLSSSSVSSPVGNVYLSIPFTSGGKNYAVTVSSTFFWGASVTNNITGSLTSSFTTAVQLFKNSPNQNFSYVTASDLVGTAGNVIRYSVLYEVAV